MVSGIGDSCGLDKFPILGLKAFSNTYVVIEYLICLIYFNTFVQMHIYCEGVCSHFLGIFIYILYFLVMMVYLSHRYFQVLF